MSQRFFELFFIAFSAFVILDGDWAYEKVFPNEFWKQKIAALEKRERRDLWRVHKEEWHLKQMRLELSLALSAAQDEAECLKVDSEICISRAKEPFITKIQKVEKDLDLARTDHERSLHDLQAAKNHSF
ncbi:MAG: hypothetical protein JSS32_08560 [Verrucomicrobia bacterium]|nr:hypothetical protein [Verrucomicrobiota bacterium]